MPHPNAALENVFGTIGAVLWSVQIIPQIWKSYRTKETEGLSTLLMFIWACAGLFLGTYAIVQNINIPIILQPQLFSTLAALSTAQCLYYGHGKPLKLCIVFFLGFCAFFGAFEAGMTFALRAGQANGTDAPVLLFGILSAVLLAGALLPQYWEIYRLGEVKGISMTFMAVDMAGGVFCILSLVFKEFIDILATINYAAVVLLDGIVVVLAVMLNPRARRRAIERIEKSGDEGREDTAREIDGGDPNATSMTESKPARVPSLKSTKKLEAPEPSSRIEDV
ncbi:hypothetical protein NliqN6_0744 [Naganishia liquefaciens]|uniref:PQ-loop repeat-containing protein n=1 Tax=Naganishia liquefaciens TaxID=104408 RepID=A0A8H3YDJ2_9TREE|nr:hypothetical protein NliqN6_0744 [Naganishia liquefaciens]